MVFKISEENLNAVFTDADGKKFAVISEVKDGIITFTGKTGKFVYGESVFDNKIRLKENFIVYFSDDGDIMSITETQNKTTAVTARSGCNFDKTSIAEHL